MASNGLATREHTNSLNWVTAVQAPPPIQCVRGKGALLNFLSLNTFGSALCTLEMLGDRLVIEQAKGFIAEHNHVSVDDAFTLLRGYARHHHHLLRQTAADVVDGTLAPETLQLPTSDKPA